MTQRVTHKQLPIALMGSASAPAIAYLLFVTLTGSDQLDLEALPNFLMRWVSIVATYGLAWHAFASWRKWKSAHAYWLPAAIFFFLWGFASGWLLAMFVSYQNQSFSLKAGFDRAIGAAWQGALSGLVFWLIRRPDRDPPNPITQAT